MASTCLRCGDNLAGLQHPHRCPGAQPRRPDPDFDYMED